jgi:hypothetical protein
MNHCLCQNGSHLHWELVIRNDLLLLSALRRVKVDGDATSQSASQDIKQLFR